MIETIKKQLKERLESYYQENYQQAIKIVVEEPKNPSLGDISIPLFNVVKVLKNRYRSWFWKRKRY